MTAPDTASNAWFRYMVMTGRITAFPANWKGWIVFLLIIAAPVGTVFLISLPDLPKDQRFLVFLAVFVLAFAVLALLIFLKGERVRMTAQYATSATEAG